MVTLLLSIVCCVPPSINTTPLLNAMYQVESGGGKYIVGDGGKAIGPYQIWKAYWQDAVEYDKTIGGKYEDCYNKEYSEKIIRAYWARYAPKNATLEQLARIHNGGCAILKRQGSKAWANTTVYWTKIQAEFRKVNFKPAPSWFQDIIPIPTRSGELWTN